jgi:hypothetical protein
VQLTGLGIEHVLTLRVPEGIAIRVLVTRHPLALQVAKCLPVSVERVGELSLLRQVHTDGLHCVDVDQYAVALKRGLHVIPDPAHFGRVSKQVVRVQHLGRVEAHQ